MNLSEKSLNPDEGADKEKQGNDDVMSNAIIEQD